MKKEYYLDPDIRRMMLFPAFFIIVAREVVNIVVLLFGGDGVDIRDYIIFLLAFIFALHTLLVAYTEKIVVSSDGITFERIGLSVFIKWQDMDRIAYRRTLGITYEGVFTPREKAVLKGIESYGVLGKEVYVNLFRYAEHWRDSELGSQIKQYAPHLFNR